MRKNILTAAALFLCAVTFAQTNLNPTVEVTNTYQGDPSAIHKPQIGMAIPDSLLRFDMDFGYEVFEKPYQGAYNFKPYMLDMKPGKDAYRGRKLYLKAGAGYSLHPQLDFVFSPDQAGPFQMSVYAGHRSYLGKYNNLILDRDDQLFKVVKDPGRSFSGYDIHNSLGFEGSYSFDKAIFSFGAGYDGLMARDSIFKRSFNAFDFNARIRSNRNDDKYIYFDLGIDGRIGGDKREGLGKMASSDSYWDNLSERSITLSGEAGPVLSPGQAVLAGFEAQTVSYGGLFESNAGRLALVPKYRMTYGKLDASLGVRFEVLLYGKVNEGARFPAMFQQKGGVVFPDVRLRYNATDKLSLFVSATGGNKLNTYSSVLSRHHFINPSITENRVRLLDNSVEKVNARIGVEGNAGDKLQLSVSGGFALVGNGIVDMGFPVYDITIPAIPAILSYLPTVSYSDYSMLYADALVDYSAGNFRLDGGLHLRKMAFKYDSDLGLALPRVSFDVKGVYDFSSRVYAGVRLQGSGGRKGRCLAPPWVNTTSYELKTPGWFDLGLLGGWQFNRKLGFWLESGNLLCETIQLSPFYSEKDLWITAGITLSL